MDENGAKPPRISYAVGGGAMTMATTTNEGFLNTLSHTMANGLEVGRIETSQVIWAAVERMYLFRIGVHD